MEEKGSAERFFGAHAEGYAKSPSHAHGEDLAVLIDALGPRPTDLALDVATGTGFTAMALAPRVRRVIGIDVTDEMLTEARKLALAQGQSNIVFEMGDALGTKFADASFDIVTTRRAAHHFKDVPGFLREAHRLLRTGGRLGVVDMSPPEGAEEFTNQIERIRDSSHVEAFTPRAWKSMLSDAGFQTRSSQILGEHITFERWLYPVKSGGSEEDGVRLAWKRAAPETSRLLQAETDGGIRGWMKSRIILIASK
ncbi:MAG: methyltransferase domain-containing protein [Nitrososphaerota archaeon]|nr:methyltransferase domain-containing protein [Nitrososphaerota archaeon]